MAPASPPPSPSATSVRSHSVSTCYTLRVPELAPALGTWAQRRRRISSFLHIHPREQSNLHRYNAERHRHDNDNDDDEEVTATHHAHHAPLSASIASHLHQLHLPTFHIAGFGLHRSQSGTLQRSESMVSLCFRSLAGFIAEDNLPGLQAFLENRQVQVDDRDENGTTPLMVAASKGRLSFVRELLAHGADPNAEDADSWTALLCSAKEGHTDICAELISHGALLEHRDPGIWTALMWAAYKGRTEVVNLLVEKGADVNAHGNFHISSLLWAAGRGHSQIVRTLVTHGAKVNIGDKYGTTALIWASRCGVADSVECLLRAGANVDTAGMYSWTSLLVATMGNHADVVHFLLEHRPNVNALDKDGCTALTISCKEGYHEIAVALLNAGAYINIQDRAGDTNLIHAVKGNHRSIVEALLKKYADVDIPGKERKTAIYNAVEKGNVAIVKMLLNANPDLEISTKDGDTALLRAVRIRNVEIVQLLLDKRAKVSAADKKGDTALHVAMRARSKGIIETLLRNPKNSHLLYRPNRQGETPYNIDLGHQKTILGQIFGARRLNTNEDNENMLGYDLYSSALADVLSEPSLSMPITVGLYAKWGSGKSFLLNKLREEMKNFARQWIEPSFQFSYLLLMLVLHTAILLGAVVGVSSGEWIAGVSTAVGLVILLHVALFVINFVNRRYDWDWPYNFNVALTKKLNSFKLILQIVFCHPPGSPGSDGVTAQPIRFYFTEQTRVSSTTSSENSVVQMLGSLYDAIETDFGALSTRLYRAFRPKLAKQNSSWRWRRLCCLPYVVIFEFCFIAALVIAVLLFYYFQIDPALQILLITFGVLLAVAIIANLYTWGRMISALTRSQRRHLHRTISCLDTLKSEGFLQALRSEVNLMTEMVKCLDRLTDQQTRLVIIVDGLDSSEQDKVLLVLDAVHLLFSDANCPFIIILAIDPHTISKALEVNSKRLFNESNIGGHDYLRNMVHLPFYLQNSGLRKVKVAQHTAQLHRRLGGSSIDEYAGPSATLGRSMSNRRLSQESGLMSSCEKLKPPPPRKGSRKLKLSDSIASSIGSNLNRIGGAHDLTKMLLTDDYFSDVNPRSMRRLLNVVYITGRLLKAFQIDFNWYHLASWINITEQWPFRTSWIILYHELHEESLDDGMSMKTLYDKIRPQIPILKEVEPLLELDRDERKFDVFLSFHRSSLLISDLKIFLPFTINLDPYIKKVIKEQQSIEEEGLLNNMPPHSHAIPQAQHNVWNNPTMPPQIWHNPMTKPPLVRRQRPYSRAPIPQQVNQMTELMYSTPPQNILAGWQPHPVAWIDQQMKQPQTFLEMPNATLSKEILELKLSTLSVDGVADLLSKLDDLTPNMRPRYEAVVKENNINGRVLSHCDLEDLKKVLIMNFGDWELFRMLIMYMRDHEHSVMSRSDEPTPVTTVSTRPVLTSTRSIAGEKNSATSSSESTQSSSVTNKGTNRHSIMEKQVTLEEQMICGALQTLNEEACEDVLDEGDSSSLRSESPEHDDGAAGGIPSVTVSGSILAGHMLNLSEPDVIIESHHLLSIDEENDGYKNGGFCQKDKYFGEINEQNPKRTKQQSLANTVLSKSIDIRETGSAQSSMYGQNAKHDSIKMGERILQQRPNSLPDNSFHLSNHTPTCSLEKLTILKDKFLSLTCDNKYNTSGNMDIDSDDESTPLVSEKSKSELTSAAESPITPASVDIVFYGQSRHASNQDLTDFTDVSPSSRCVESPKNKLNCNSSCNVLSPDEIANFSLSTSDVTHTCVINTGNCYPLLSKDRGDSLSNAYGKIESGFSRQNAVDEYDCEDFYGDPETTV